MWAKNVLYSDSFSHTKVNANADDDGKCEIPDTTYAARAVRAWYGNPGTLMGLQFSPLSILLKWMLFHISVNFRNHTYYIDI